MWRALRLLAPALALLLAPLEARAQQTELETAVKATFFYRFGAFVDWPQDAFASAEAPFAICISGPSHFADVVENAATDERIAGRAVVIRRIGAVTRESGCQVLFVGGVADQTIEQGLAIVRGAPVLTVTDEQYGRTRGAIHFVVVDERVRFHVDRGAIEGNRLSVSSRLLNIALSVRRRGGAGR